MSSPRFNVSEEYGVRRRDPRFIDRKMRGVSLVDLLVGVAIGILVVIAALGSLSFVKASAVSISEASRLQQRSDAIFRNIGFHLAQAGSVEIQASKSNASMVNFKSSFVGFRPTVTLAQVTGASKQIYSIHGVNGTGLAGSTSPDTLRISYENNGSSRDCLSYVVSGIHVNNQFSVSGQDMMCQGSTEASSQSIGSGVEDFQVLYGASIGSQFMYYRADEMLGFGLAPNWEIVQAVSICLQLVSETQANPGIGSRQVGCRDQSLASDGRIRRVYRRTFALRNALP